MTTAPRPETNTESEHGPKARQQYGPESVGCAKECGAPAGKPCDELEAGKYHRTRVVAANSHRARDLAWRLIALTTVLSDRLRQATVSEITYQVGSGRLQEAFSTLLFHMRHENIPVMPEDQDEIEALNDVIVGGL
jgi:hypothetical protein